MRWNIASVSLLVCLVCARLISPPAIGVSQLPPDSAAPYSNSSWALGVVVPEGSQLNNGAGLRWESVGNLTVLVSLPNITLPDRVVYSILSVMTGDGGVMQVAAGVYPNRSAWMAYSWAIPNAGSVPLTYAWLLNGSDPSMRQSERISMAIYRASGLWNLKVADWSTGESVVRSFPPATDPSLMVGGQEVFALESYSRSSSTFRSMGNLTLDALMVDGQNVTKGAYAYGGWDPSHTPLFSVGSAGTSPPAFISLIQPKSGSFVWGFSGFWEGEPALNGWVVIMILAGTAAAAAVLVALAWFVTGRGGGRSPSNGRRFPRMRTVSSG